MLRINSEWVYLSENRLSKSEYSHVYKCKNQSTGISGIVKILPKKTSAARFSYNEVEKMRRLQGKHPGILNIWEIIETDNYFYLIMEEISTGDLLNYVNTHEYFSETEIFHIFSQIVEVIGFLHDQNLAHRDIKLENFLITAAKQIKIIDFGFTMNVPESQLVNDTSGTLHYAAPELLSGNPNNPYKTDIWAMGVILYCLIFHQLPFRNDPEDRTKESLRRRIRGGIYSIPTRTIYPAPSSGLLNLLSSMIQVDSDIRVDIDEIKRSEWYTSHLNRKIPLDPSPDTNSSNSNESSSCIKKNSVPARSSR